MLLNTQVYNAGVGRGRMLLLTRENRAALPPLYANEKIADPIVQVKFFNPVGSWTWYALEFDGVDTFFGLVVGHEAELGYFSLSELAGLKLKWGMGIERDRHFPPTPLSKVRERHGLDR